VLDAATRFIAHGGKWRPSVSLARTINEAALEQIDCRRLSVMPCPQPQSQWCYSRKLGFSGLAARAPERRSPPTWRRFTRSDLPTRSPSSSRPQNPVAPRRPLR
jgi:hypothetical protein